MKRLPIALAVLSLATMSHAEDVDVYLKSPRFIVKTVEDMEQSTAGTLQEYKETIKLDTQTGDSWMLADGNAWRPLYVIPKSPVIFKSSDK
jgi:hypothetical protein